MYPNLEGSHQYENMNVNVKCPKILLKWRKHYYYVQKKISCDILLFSASRLDSYEIFEWPWVMVIQSLSLMVHEW